MLPFCCFQCPAALQKELVQENNSSSGSTSHSPSDVVTRRTLVRLHRRVIATTQRYNCTQNQWSKSLHDAINLEDVVLNEFSRNTLACRITNDTIFSRCYSPAIGNIFYSVSVVLLLVNDSFSHSTWLCSLTYAQHIPILPSLLPFQCSAWPNWIRLMPTCQLDIAWTWSNRSWYQFVT